MLDTFAQPDSSLAVLLRLLLGGVVFYLALSGASYMIFFVWLRRRFNPGYRSDWAMNLRAIRRSLGSTAGNAVLAMPFHVLAALGYSRLYFDVDERGWAYLLASVALVLAVTETLIYWIHRGLHASPFYERLHFKHHEFRRPNSWVSMAFHPLDSFAQALPYHLCIFLFPVHVGVYLALLTLVAFWSVVIHDQTTLIRWRVLNYTDHHTLHHWHNYGNFGQFFTLWDRLAGTYIDPVRSGVLRRLRNGQRIQGAHVAINPRHAGTLTDTAASRGAGEPPDVRPGSECLE